MNERNKEERNTRMAGFCAKAAWLNAAITYVLYVVYNFTLGTSEGLESILTGTVLALFAMLATGVILLALFSFILTSYDFPEEQDDE